MPKRPKAVAADPRDRLDAIRTWTITLGISAFLLAVMYTAAVLHYGAPHLGDAESAISELARG